MQCLSEHDMCVVQDDEKIKLAKFWKDTARTEPYDLTGSTITVSIRKDQNTVHTITIDSFEDPTTGEVDIDLSEVTGWPLGKYRYHIRLKKGAGKPKTILRGTLDIVWQVPEEQ